MNNFSSGSCVIEKRLYAGQDIIQNMQYTAFRSQKYSGNQQQRKANFVPEKKYLQVKVVLC